MALNLEKMKQEREKRKAGGETWDAPEGDTAVYVCPPFRETDELPYWEYKVHWGLGKKGRTMAVCLETYNNPILEHPAMLEELAFILGKGEDREMRINDGMERAKKVLKEGCAACDKHGAGELSDDNRQSSRWVWVVVPIKHRASSSGPYTPFTPANQVSIFPVGYKVWDGISDQFGSCGDITNPNEANLVRVIREGKKLQTKWDVQIDAETLKKPLKLGKDLLALIAEAMVPGGRCDPYRYVASAIRPRAEVEKLLQGEVDDDDFEADPEDEETTTEESKGEDKPKGKHAPPTGKKDKPADKPKADKPKDKPKNGKADVDMEALKKQRGGDPPSCFQIDPDSEMEECQKCQWKVECATHLGVPVPPDPPGDSSSSEEESSTIAVKDCQPGSTYKLFGKQIATYKGPAKGKFYFTGEDGKPIPITDGDVEVEAMPDSAGAEEPEEDEELAKLEAEMAAAKAKKAAKQKSA